MVIRAGRLCHLGVITARFRWSQLLYRIPNAVAVRSESVDDLAGERLALAALRLREAGDRTALVALLDTLTPEELRAALLAQTRNAGLVLHAAFGGRLVEDALPAAVTAGRPRAEVVDDYLGHLITGYALAENDQP
jgi:hypothetical protein